MSAEDRQGLGDDQEGADETKSSRVGKEWAEKWELQKSDNRIGREKFSWKLETGNKIELTFREGRTQEVPLFVQTVDYVAPDEIARLERINALPQIMLEFYSELDRLMNAFLTKREKSTDFEYAHESVLSLSEDCLCVYWVRFAAQFPKMKNDSGSNTIQEHVFVDLESLAPDQVAEYEKYAYWVIDHLRQYLEHTPFTVISQGEGSVLNQHIIIVFDEQKNIVSNVLPDEVKDITDVWFTRWMTEFDSSRSPNIEVRDHVSKVEDTPKEAQTLLINYISPSACILPTDVNAIFNFIQPGSWGNFQKIKIRFGEVINAHTVLANFNTLAESQRTAYTSFGDYIYEQIKNRFKYTQFSAKLIGKDVLTGEIVITEDEHKEGEISYLLRQKRNGTEFSGVPPWEIINWLDSNKKE